MCNGTGHADYAIYPCSYCNGTGIAQKIVPLAELAKMLVDARVTDDETR
jgi:predicted nucleic acid binding AN1-type Zn finger protein